MRTYFISLDSIFIKNVFDFLILFLWQLRNKYSHNSPCWFRPLGPWYRRSRLRSCTHPRILPRRRGRKAPLKHPGAFFRKILLSSCSIVFSVRSHSVCWWIRNDFCHYYFTVCCRPNRTDQLVARALPPSGHSGNKKE